jgi:hypothetical protein
MKRAAIAASLVAAWLAGSCDPVKDHAIDALPGDAPGVRNGPLHRPGQPCLLCHDGALGDPDAFSMAGTVFQDANSLTPLDGAILTLENADGTTVTATTNAAGNFYLNANQYTPRYPVRVKSIVSGTTSILMQSHIGGNGSCAGCHVDPAGPDSPGHVYFTITGTPP